MIDHSTVSSETAKQAHALMQAAGGDFLDAPVSGGVEGAKNGKLSIMAGGDAATLERVRPCSRPTPRASATWAGRRRAEHQGGESGAGRRHRARRVRRTRARRSALGLDPDVLLPTLLSGAAGCWFLDKRGATMLRNEFAGGFKLALLHKDLNIVRDLAEAAGTDRSIIEKSLADYAELMAQGHGDEEISALIRLKRGKR